MAIQHHPFIYDALTWVSYEKNGGSPLPTKEYMVLTYGHILANEAWRRIPLFQRDSQSTTKYLGETHRLHAGPMVMKGW